MHQDAKKRKPNINTVSHDAPTVSARFIYGYPKIQDGNATIHHGGATNAHDASTIRYGLVRFKSVAPRPPPRTVFVMNRGRSG